MPSDPAALLKMAADQNGLTSPDLKPWYLKASYTTFDEQGQAKDTGVFEEWWASSTKYKRRYVSKSLNLTLYVTDTGTYRVGANRVPFVESLLPDRLLAPVPVFKGNEWDRLLRHKQNFGGATLDCVVLARHIPDLDSAPVGLFPTYCVDPAKPILRLSGSFGQYNTVYNQTGLFRGKYIAQELAITEQPSRNILTAHVERLTGLAVNDADFQPPGDAIAVAAGKTTELSTQVVEGHLIKKVPPMYPAAAKQKHIEGRVVVQAEIGEDGRIHQMTIVSAPDSLLASAAMMAVKQWEYQPYLFQGEPVRVQTQITVVFRLSP